MSLYVESYFFKTLHYRVVNRRILLTKKPETTRSLEAGGIIINNK